MPSRKPAAIAMKPIAITRRASCSGETLAASDASWPSVMATNVCECSHESFQMAVLRS
jgi:hypothetical protein